MFYEQPNELWNVPLIEQTKLASHFIICSGAYTDYSLQLTGILRRYITLNNDNFLILDIIMGNVQDLNHDQGVSFQQKWTSHKLVIEKKKREFNQRLYELIWDAWRSGSSAWVFLTSLH